MQPPPETTVETTLGFIAETISFFLFQIEGVLGNSDLAEVSKVTLVSVYSLILLILLVLFFLAFRLILQVVVRGVAASFAFLSESLKEPGSIPYAATLFLVQSVPWYFLVLLIMLGFVGIAALLTGNNALWVESFKYILGATVGSLIGVIKRQEQAEFEGRIFQALVPGEPREVSDQAE